MNSELLNRFLDEEGKVKIYPTKYAKQIEVLKYLSTKFEINKKYDEQDVNCIIASWICFDDFSTIRRGLVDFKLLCRTKEGKVYWKNETIE